MQACRKFWMSLWPSLTGKSLKPFFALDVPRALASSAVLDGRKSRTGRRSSSKPPQVSPWNSHNSAPQSEHCLLANAKLHEHFRLLPATAPHLAPNCFYQCQYVCHFLWRWFSAAIYVA